MEVDVEPTPSTSLASTQKPQTEKEDLEIQVIGMSKEDKIARLVKIHVANHQKFMEAQKSKATQEMMLNLLGLAQKSHKELQKFISKKEVEEYSALPDVYGQLHLISNTQNIILKSWWVGKIIEHGFKRMIITK
ncbi:hypothetical protein PCANC_12434 [Puccinia coronata f. sp. avenae]|uniref:Uncharacterized protein n=1 Tax=Puccinia coronata f. sp. avenae TaxID=200324 RepID=A0A2N5VB84_9BASI|nr:hypothetical protein PCANC_12434 [Puccinia coronata f. sp. avenae]